MTDVVFRARSEFRGRAWQWVDPQKEMTAAVMGLKNGILTLPNTDVAAKFYGKDVEELLAQIQRDKSLMEQFGVKYALEPYAAQIYAGRSRYSKLPLGMKMASYKGRDINTKPTDEMAEEAQRGLDWRKEHGRGGTVFIGVARARDISNGKELSITGR